MAFSTSLEVLTSREFKISGAIGSVKSLNKSGANVSDITVGVGGTSAWSLGGTDPTTTVALYFDDVPAERQCWEIKVRAKMRVQKLRPAVVQVYDYYNQEDIESFFEQHKVKSFYANSV